jgi:hypothetical protein
MEPWRRRRVLRTVGYEPEEGLRQVGNLAGLRPGNHSIKVGILAALEFAFPPLGGALSATVLLVELFLSTDPLSLALFHTLASQAGLNFRLLKEKDRSYWVRR